MGGSSWDMLKELIYILIQLIPMGYVTTYGSIARLLGVSPRLVGLALAQNSLPIIIPCHRVVRGDGSLGGYSFGGPEFKRMLLRLEGVVFDGDRVDRRCIIDVADLVG